MKRREFLAALLAPLLPVPGGTLVGNVPLGRFDGRPSPSLGVLIGSGLDARRFTDLATLEGGSLLTPTDTFFVRTAAAPGQVGAETWRVEVTGRAARTQSFTIDALRSAEQDAGEHLIECAGNSDPANFGLMSSARWHGVPIAALLDRVEPHRDAVRVLVSGLDPSAAPSRPSAAGASWVMHRDDVVRTGAFLATRMNGQPLPADHGSPVRLVVPGWYGCSCIKWVNRIELVTDDAAATPQMVEFARRTHQQGVPRLAAEYAAPSIDVAATPVRVEHWLVDGRPVYRVVGIVWGGERPARALSIRFRLGEPFVQVSDYQPPASTSTWALWSHTWRPSAPGTYRIALRADDPSVRSRRLDVFFYVREVRIDQA